MTPAGVVLTGGRSSRMGTDKAVMKIDGVTLAVRVATALAGAGCEPVVCQGGDHDALTALGLRVLPDRSPGSGPLSAIRDAIEWAGGDVVVSACDLPWIESGVVADLIAAAEADPECDVAVATDGRGPHMLALWRARTGPALERLLASGVRSYRGALEQLAARAVDVPSEAVVNLNTPQDLPGAPGADG